MKEFGVRLQLYLKRVCCESLLQALREDARVKSMTAADVKGIVTNGQRLSIEEMRP